MIPEHLRNPSPRRPLLSGIVAQPATIREKSMMPALPPSRQGKVAIAGYFDPVVRQQLGILAIEQNRSQVALQAEALNLLFEHYGKSPIAQA